MAKRDFVAYHIVGDAHADKVGAISRSSRDSRPARPGLVVGSFAGGSDRDIAWRDGACPFGADGGAFPERPRYWRLPVFSLWGSTWGLNSGQSMTLNAAERWKQRRRAPQPTPHHGATQIGRRNDSGGLMLEEASRAKDGHADAPEQLPLPRGRAG